MKENSSSLTTAGSRTAEEAAKLSEEEGRKETLTYQILAAHNHSGDMKTWRSSLIPWVFTITPMSESYRLHTPAD